MIDLSAVPRVLPLSILESESIALAAIPFPSMRGMRECSSNEPADVRLAQECGYTLLCHPILQEVGVIGSVRRIDDTKNPYIEIRCLARVHVFPLSEKDEGKTATWIPLEITELSNDFFESVWFQLIIREVITRGTLLCMLQDARFPLSKAYEALAHRGKINDFIDALSVQLNLYGDRFQVPVRLYRLLEETDTQARLEDLYVLCVYCCGFVLWDEMINSASGEMMGGEGEDPFGFLNIKQRGSSDEDQEDVYDVDVEEFPEPELEIPNEEDPTPSSDPDETKDKDKK